MDPWHWQVEVEPWTAPFSALAACGKFDGHGTHLDAAHDPDRPGPLDSKQNQVHTSSPDINFETASSMKQKKNR